MSCASSQIVVPYHQYGFCYSSIVLAGSRGARCRRYAVPTFLYGLFTCSSTGGRCRYMSCPFVRCRLASSYDLYVLY